MGYLLNIPQGTKSISRRGNIWTSHAIQHSLHSWLETNWDYMQQQTDHSNAHENSKHVNFDYKVGDKVLIKKMASYTKQSPYGKTTLDYNNSTYKWNYQDSMQNQIWLI